MDERLFDPRGQPQRTVNGGDLSQSRDSNNCHFYILLRGAHYPACKVYIRWVQQEILHHFTDPEYELPYSQELTVRWYSK